MTARLALFALGFVACAAGPRALVMGEDACTHCHMTLADPRFGGEIVTRTGRIEAFDAVECLTEALGTREAEDIRSIWVVDYERPGALLPAGEAFFVQSPAIRSPMGGGLAAFGTAAGRDSALAAVDGTVLTWREVRDRG